MDQRRHASRPQGRPNPQQSNARRPNRRKGRRRLNPGFVLFSVCSVLIVLCLGVGGIQYLVEQGEAKELAAQQAAEQAAREEEERKAQEAAAAAEAAKYDFTLAFMGDVNLDDSWPTMEYLAQQPNGITDCLDPNLLARAQAADLFCVNSEFAFTDGGEALDGKAYTFRSNPSNVSIYQTMGVDLVTLANNHVYDFGPQGLTDTLATLDGASIAHVGAGETLADAAAPYYQEIDGKTVAFVNASCAEKNRYTPEATEDSSGILLCYETDKFLAAIREAKANADFVIALVHWGTDYVYETSEEQRTTGQAYLDAGADAVIGTHSHSLQGIEYYNGKPIFYSLGSCWFNEKTLETFLLELHFTGDGNGGTMTATLVPAMQTGCTTRLTESDEEWQQVVDLVLEYSGDIHIDANGVVGEGPAPEETPDATDATQADTGEADPTATPEDTADTSTVDPEDSPATTDPTGAPENTPGPADDDPEAVG